MPPFLFAFEHAADVILHKIYSMPKRYTLLVGKPPFETKTLNETYSRIKRNKYTIPPGLDADAALLIRELLQDDPKARPNISQVLDSAFLQGENIINEQPSSQSK